MRGQSLTNFFATPKNSPFGKLANDLDVIGEPSGSQSNPFPLFFVSDKLSKATFLVDTGASFSVLPMHTCDPSLITAASVDTLTTIGGGCLPCRGLVTCSVDLGFSRFLTHEFLVTELPYGILGIDFLRRFRLNVDVSNGTLTESMDVERCARDLLDEALHAYHPQSQGLVERFNRSLKSSLRAYENSSDWYDNLPWVLLALRNSPKQNLHSLSPSDFVFGQPVRLPGKFFVVNSATQSPTHEYVSKFSKYISRLAYCAPRTANRESHLDAALFSPSCTHVYIRIDSHRSSLAPFYRGPYRVISKHAKYFSVDFREHSDTVSIDRLKAAQFFLLH